MNTHRFDAYSLQARIAPVLLVVVPIVTVCLFVPQIGGWYASIPAVFVVAGGLFAEEITRQLGKNLEGRLAREWGGLPTIRALRHRGVDEEHLKARHRREVAALTGEALPTKAEEEADPSGADLRYDDAVRRCFAEARRLRPKAMLSDENARYGFRRNLLALKPIAFITMGGSLFVDIAIGAEEHASLALCVAVAVIVVDFVLWILFVRKEWVRAQAETLSHRFFLEISALP